MSDTDKKNDIIIKQIIENYENLEKSIVSQLLMETPNHHPTTGTYREQIWEALFQQIIPKKFAIEQGIFVIDSYGNISSEVDLAIFDEQYTPYIFNYGKIRFIPIEAVAVVVQCKSKSIENENLHGWVESVDKLKTSTKSVVRVIHEVFDNEIKGKKKNGDKFRTQTATRPLKILCYLKDDKTNSVSENLFDIILSAKKGDLCLEKIISSKNNDLSMWYEYLNHAQPDEYESWIKKCDIKKNLFDLKIIKQGEKENVILSLIFQLNQLLMLINNPMLFPHQAYVDMFNKHINDDPS